MKIKEILLALEELAPINYQETYDNSGLITGDPEMHVNEVLICLDCIESVVDEAIRKNCKLIIAHHPIVFTGLKKLTGRNYVERVLIKAIKNDIAIYAIHTNLDNVLNGVNSEICKRLEITRAKVLSPVKGTLRKLTTFVPASHLDTVRDHLFRAGAGNIGNYSECSFSSVGSGTFKGNDQSNPFLGEKGIRSLENEMRIEVIFESRLESLILRNLKESHPYEEIAYYLHALENTYSEVGSGMVGYLETPLPVLEFLKRIKTKINSKSIKYTVATKELIKKVAVCGGAGRFLLPAAIAAGADVFISSDFKYHQFFDADNKIMVVDVGHFESEQFTIDLIGAFLCKKFPKFAVHLTEINTNPINYI